jgi:hypothetical protein
MISSITDLIGREGAAGFALYLGAAFVLSGPIAGRHADRHLVDLCKTGHTSQALPGMSFTDQAQNEIAKSLKRDGGPIGELIGGLITLKSTLEKRREAENAAADAAICGCRIRLALQKSDVKWSWFSYTATWRLYDDAPGQTLATARAINVDNLCGRGVL